MSAVQPTGAAQRGVNGETDEREWVERAKSGDQTALAWLFDEHYPRVFRYLRSKAAQPEDAEDLAQEVFLRMCTGLEKYQQRGIPFKAWLMQIAANLLKDYYRKGSGPARTASLNDTELEALDERDPVGAVEVQLTLEEVTVAMQHLTELEREVIRLRYAAELSIAETAATIGKTENNVKQLTFKALGKLRRVMSQPDAGSR